MGFLYDSTFQCRCTQTQIQDSAAGEKKRHSKNPSACLQTINDQILCKCGFGKDQTWSQYRQIPLSSRPDCVQIVYRLSDGTSSLSCITVLALVPLLGIVTLQHLCLAEIQLEETSLLMNRTFTDLFCCR